jgi:uncharacterized protein YbaA (DUF1428 family)
MARYVEGYVIPVLKKRRADYVKLARLSRKVWLEFGALEYRECVAADVEVGKLTSFPRSVNLKRGEEVWFAWTVYKSRRQRDQIMAKVMKDPRMMVFVTTKKLPFDSKRMFWGGFTLMVSE